MRKDTIQSHANRYAKGKRDALLGLPRDPGVVLPYSYRQGYKKGLAKLKAAMKKPKPDRNPVAHCAACYKPRREKAFEVYDSANDNFYCTDEERIKSYERD